MKVDNNLNSMIQLNNKLEKSANELAKLNNSGNQQTLPKEKQNTKQTNSKEESDTDDSDIVKEPLKQSEIPIAYTANAEVISTQNSETKTFLDITA